MWNSCPSVPDASANIVVEAENGSEMRQGRLSMIDGETIRLYLFKLS